MAVTNSISQPAIRRAIRQVDSAASARLVNRTHRVVRERARTMRANRNRMRSLLLPLFLCSSLMILVFSAFWLVLDQYELLASEPSSAHSHHLFLLLLWFVPASGALFAIVWFRRSRQNAEAQSSR